MTSPADPLSTLLGALGASAAIVEALPGRTPIHVAANALHAALESRPLAGIVGSPFPGFDGYDGLRLAAALATALAERRTVEIEHRSPSRGEARWWRTLVVPLLEPHAAPTRALVLSAEVTEQHRIEARLRAELAEVMRELEVQASTDGLTGAVNRRSTMQRIEEEVARASRHGRPLAMLMLDLDRFKAVNDEHGHAAGDEVLRAFAAEVRAELRPSDLLGRVGGEEFVALLPETSAEGAIALAERLRARVAARRVAFEGASIGVTVSIGAAALASGQSARDLLRAADDALYEAKRAGRDRVSWVGASGPLSTEPPSR